MKRDFDFGETPRERREAVETELDRGGIESWSNFDAAMKNAQSWIPTEGPDSNNGTTAAILTIPRSGSKKLLKAIWRQRAAAKRLAMKIEVRTAKAVGLGSKSWFESVKRQRYNEPTVASPKGKESHLHPRPLLVGFNRISASSQMQKQSTLKVVSLLPRAGLANYQRNANYGVHA